MAPILRYVLPLASLIESLVSAHGFVSRIIVDKAVYPGGRDSNTARWKTTAYDDYVPFYDLNNPDVICHWQGTPSSNYIPAKAGSKITFQWNDWPINHIGLVMTYIAKCPGECTNVDKTTLRFVKIDEAGWKGGYAPGAWATDDFMKADYTWNMTMPSIVPGNYVVRHELMALHNAYIERAKNGGAQPYPQCINFKIGGNGTNVLPAGTLGRELYNQTDPSLLINAYTKFTSYKMPGPALVKFI